MQKNIKVRVLEHVMQALKVEKYKDTCKRTCKASIKCRQNIKVRVIEHVMQALNVEQNL
jgi:hypothetical protein